MCQRLQNLPPQSLLRQPLTMPTHGQRTRT
jgi:hypothetical protein